METNFLRILVRGLADVQKTHSEERPPALSIKQETVNPFGSTLLALRAAKVVSFGVVAVLAMADSSFFGHTIVLVEQQACGKHRHFLENLPEFSDFQVMYQVTARHSYQILVQPFVSQRDGKCLAKSQLWDITVAHAL